MSPLLQRSVIYRNRPDSGSMRPRGMGDSALPS